MSGTLVTDFERTLSQYFHERLVELGETITPKPHEDTLWYLGGMLGRLGQSTNVFTYDHGRLTLRPLALLYHDALSVSEGWQCCLLLRQLGDLSLFLGGLFSERYAKKGIGQDYFVGMGGSAYDYLADNAQQNRHIFSELAVMFVGMLELVARVCSKQNPFDAMDVMALIQRYRQTSDPVAARQLEGMGIALTGVQTLQ